MGKERTVKARKAVEPDKFFSLTEKWPVDTPAMGHLSIMVVGSILQ